MNKQTLLLILCVVRFLNIASSQNPLLKKWDYRYGGNEIEWLNCLLATDDNGCIIGGRSFSNISGDKSQNLCNGSFDDFWIVKIDSLGNKEWEKDFGGASANEVYAILQTSDKGYLLGGYSSSGISCDKSVPTFGADDYWIVKLDSSGNKQWDKDFGGTAIDVLTSMDQARDGGFILGGYTISGIGGNKSQACWGGCDYWIVKVDSLGNFQWDQDYGGTLDDYLYSVRQTHDGGYILGGYSDSDVGGNKSQNSWGSSQDYWIIKTDSLGNKLWDKDYGGIYLDRLLVLETTLDNGFILGGITRSGTSGNKTSSIHGIPGYDFDFWIIKTDSTGTKDWEKNFGASDGEDDFNSITLTSDSCYLITGTSYSNAGGDKTESNMGQEQSWTLKIDSLGNILWDKTIFTPCHDDLGFGVQTQDGCYVFANTNAMGCGGGGYRTQACWNNSSDFWVAKFCETLLAGFTSPTSICPGTCVDFTNLSFNATTYQWNFFGASPDTSTSENPQGICYTNAGSYEVQLIASNANGSDTLTLQNYITVFPQPPGQSITQSGDTLFAIAGSSSYQWYYNGNILTGATNYFYIAQSSGDYNVVATDSNGCEVEAVINDVLASAQAAVGSSSRQSIQVYPNPVTETFYIIGLKNNTVDEIKIFNVFGEIVFSAVDWKPGTGNWKLFPSGLYYLEILSDKKLYRAKFIKE